VRDRLAERDRRGRVSERLAWARLATFLAAALLFWRSAAMDGAAARAFGVATAAAVIVFVWLVRRHRVETTQTDWLGALARVNAEAAHRVRRDWKALPDPRWREADPEHPYSVDLDLLGHASLAHLLPRVSSAPGQETLRSWLLAPATPSMVRERQAAVADLTSRIDFRDALTALGARIWLASTDQRALEEWSLGHPGQRGGRTLVAASIALPVATIALAVAARIEIVSWTPALVSLALSALLSGLYAGALKRTLVPVADKTDALRGYADMTRLVSEASFESPLMRRLQSGMADGDQRAHMALASLRVLADLSQVRSSPMLHAALQWLLLWDFHVARAVERWHARHGRDLSAWLRALGEVESLAALAGLAHGNPAWTFPTVDPDAVGLEATALGHPLLADGVRVANDVTVGAPGSFLLVTGSNMSGKSTLLRAIGLNVVLAQAGAPVCAASLRCPPLAVHTSMRIRDSLEMGVSYFMAEVLRLRDIVDAARANGGSRGMVLYLFDEMLQGTNAAERTLAAQRILEYLASTRAIGALATHDLAVLDSPAVAGAARLVHFREDVVQGPDGPELRFDYRLRPGRASSTNALKLMELAGLPVTERTG
jgi:hypothetical protein